MEKLLKKITVLFGILVLVLFGVSGAVWADEENSGDDQTAVAEEQSDASGEEVSEEESVTMDDESVGAEEEVAEPSEQKERAPGSVKYYDGTDTGEGSVTLMFKIDESDADSPFFGRYHDAFAGKDFILYELLFRQGGIDAPYIKGGITDTWDPSYHGFVEYWDPGVLRFWTSDRDYKNYNVPTMERAERHDFNIGFESYGSRGGVFSGGYAYRENAIDRAFTNLTYKSWESSDWNLAYKFSLGCWDGSAEYRDSSFDDRNGSSNDVNYRTTSLKLGTKFSGSDYLEVYGVHNFNDMPGSDDLESFTFGGYARFNDALGVNSFDVTSRLKWTDTNAGPSKLHPAGDSFKFDLAGKIHPADELWFWGGYQTYQRNFTWADMVTNRAFRNDPTLSSVPDGLFYDDSVTTGTWNFGGKWRISDGLDFTADFKWVDRGDLPNTFWVTPYMSTLWFDSINTQEYTIRYNGGYGMDNGGDWLLKYVIKDRDNGARQSSTKDEHFTVNWTGMLTSEFWAYAGAGFLNNQITTGNSSYSQDGTEWGGGFSWNMNEAWILFGDLWYYSVDGIYAYDETSYSAGLSYDPNEDWRWSVEWNGVEGDFDSQDFLNYSFEQFLLKLTSRW